MDDYEDESYGDYFDDDEGYPGFVSLNVFDEIFDDSDDYNDGVDPDDAADRLARWDAYCATQTGHYIDPDEFAETAGR